MLLNSVVDLMHRQTQGRPQTFSIDFFDIFYLHLSSWCPISPLIARLLRMPVMLGGDLLAMLLPPARPLDPGLRPRQPALVGSRSRRIHFCMCVSVCDIILFPLHALIYSRSTSLPHPREPDQRGCQRNHRHHWPGDPHHSSSSLIEGRQ